MEKSAKQSSDNKEEDGNGRTQEHRFSTTLQSEQQFPQNFQIVREQPIDSHYMSPVEYRHGISAQIGPVNYSPVQSAGMHSYHYQQRFSGVHTQAVDVNEYYSSYPREIPPGNYQRYPIHYNHSQRDLESGYYPHHPTCPCSHCKRTSIEQHNYYNPIQSNRNDNNFMDISNNQKVPAYPPNVDSRYHSHYQIQQQFIPQNSVDISEQIQELKNLFMTQMKSINSRFQEIETKLASLEIDRQINVSGAYNENSQLNKSLKESSYQEYVASNEQISKNKKSDNEEESQNGISPGNRESMNPKNYEEQLNHQELHSDKFNIHEGTKLTKTQESRWSHQIDRNKFPIKQLDETTLSERKSSESCFTEENKSQRDFNDDFSSDRNLTVKNINIAEKELQNSNDSQRARNVECTDDISECDEMNPLNFNFESNQVLLSESNLIEEHQYPENLNELLQQSPTFSADSTAWKDLKEKANHPFQNFTPAAQHIISELTGANSSASTNPLGVIAKTLSGQNTTASTVIQTIFEGGMQLLSNKKRGSNLLKNIVSQVLGVPSGSDNDISDDDDDDYRSSRRTKKLPHYQYYADNSDIESEFSDNSSDSDRDFKENIFQNNSQILEKDENCNQDACGKNFNQCDYSIDSECTELDKDSENEEDMSHFQAATDFGSTSHETIISQLNNVVTDQTIISLSNLLDLPQCQSMCRKLGLREGIIQDIKIEQQQFGCEESRYNMIIRWKQTQGMKATIGALIQGLVFVDRGDIVMKLFPEIAKIHPQKGIFEKQVKLSDEEASDVLQKIQKYLKSLYIHVQLPMTSWFESKTLSLEKLYVDLKMFPKDKDGLEDIGKEMTLQDIFMQVDGEYPNRILVEGPPGYGKSTLTYKLTLDWSKNENYIGHFDLVFIIALRYFQGNLEKTLINECRVENITDAVKLALIRYYEARILLILDGYDELSDDHKVSLSSLLKGEKYPLMTVLLTSRTGLFKLPMKKIHSKEWTGGHVDMISKRGKDLAFWRKRVEIKGISEENRKKFLQIYLNTDADKLYSKLDHVMSEEMRNLYECPLILILLALLVEERGVEKIKTKTELYKEVFNFIIRRSLARESYKSEKGRVDLFLGDNEEFYFTLLLKFGEFALKKLSKYSLMFDEKEILENCNNDDRILKLGFLTKNLRISEHRKIEFYEPIHKTFLEFLSALYLWYLSIKNSTENDTLESKICLLVKDGIFEQKDSLLFIFLAGLLEDKCGILLRHLSRWSYSLSAYEFPISSIIKETQCFGKLTDNFLTFIPTVFHLKDNIRNDFNKNITSFAISQKCIKIFSLNIHNMLNIPKEINVEILQLDIWGKDVTKQLRFYKSMTINCKTLICWIYGITQENWKYYAQFINSINAEEISIFINAYDDYKQISLILTNIERELNNGLWQSMKLKYLKVLGLDGKNDRQSLPLITKLIQQGSVTNGLVVSIKSVFGSFQTFGFWFKTRFLRRFREIIFSFFKFLHSVASFRENLKPDIDKVKRNVQKRIKKLKVKFESTLKKFDKNLFCLTEFDSSDSSSDEMKFFAPLGYAVAEEKYCCFLQNLKENLTNFLRDVNDLLQDVQKDNTLTLLFGFQRKFNNLISYVCKYLESCIDELSDSDSDSDSDDNKFGLSTIGTLAKHGVAAINTFNKEFCLFIDAVRNSKLQKFALNNGYFLMKYPSLNPNKLLTGRKWDYFHVENKIKISSKVKINSGKYEIHNLGIALGSKESANEAKLILKCPDLSSLSCKSNLIHMLEEENWKGFYTLKELYWYLYDGDEEYENIFKSFKHLYLLSIHFGGLIEGGNYNNFPHLPFHSLKVLELREVDSETLDICSAIFDDMFETNIESDETSGSGHTIYKTVKPNLTDLRLDLENLLDDEALENIFTSAKTLMLNRNILKLTLLSSNECQEPFVTKMFSFDKNFNVHIGSNEFQDSDSILFHQNIKSSIDIKTQWIITMLN